MDIYAENILDHFHSPRGKEPLKKISVEHSEENASCGDTLTIKFAIDGEKITGISWDGTGCAISQAAMSMLTEELAGMSLEEAEKLSKEKIYAMLGVPIGPRRFKCALLSLHALKNAIRSFRKQPPQEWTETIEVNGAVQGN